jgi:hypothetical protein
MTALAPDLRLGDVATITTTTLPAALVGAVYTATIAYTLTTDDLVLVDGDLALTDGSAAVVQAVKQRLRFFLGEWFADESIGTPYFQSILVKAPSLPAIREIFRREILATPGIASVTSVDLDHTATARSLTVTFVAVMEDGTTISDSLEVTA